MTLIRKVLGTDAFTGWHMLGVMGLFFGTIISVNLVLAWYANSTWSGLVVKNSYVESQRFNEVTAQMEKSVALGWISVLDYSQGMVRLHLKSADGKPVSIDSVEARIGRPANAAQDRTVRLVGTGDGAFEGQTALAKGVWQAELSAIAEDGVLWRHLMRFTLKEPQS